MKGIYQIKRTQEPEYKYSAFKKYCNKLIGLLKINRQSHYQNYFNENNKNSRTLWQEINKIIYSGKTHKTNSPSSISVDNGYKYHKWQSTLISILLESKNLQKGIPPTKTHFSDFSKDTNQSSLFI